MSFMIEEIEVGDIVVLEYGAPGEPGYATHTFRVVPDKTPSTHEKLCIGSIRQWVRNNKWRITSITTPPKPEGVLL